MRDPNYFKMVKLSGHTLVWPNEADFCPDVLYEIGKETQEQEKLKANALTKKRPKKV